MRIRGYEELGSLTASELADELLRQRDALRAVKQRQAELRDRVRAYEVEFGVASSELHAAIDRGELRETEAVADWLIAYDTLLDLDAA
jgi:hypothetical protein